MAGKAVKHQIKHQVWLWPGVFMMAAPKLSNTAHLHYPASLYVGVDADVSVKAGDKTLRGRLVLVRSNTEQEVNSHNRPLIDLLIDADWPAYQQLEPLLEGASAVVLPDVLDAGLHSQLRALSCGVACAEAWQTAERLLNQLCGYEALAPAKDERITAVANSLKANLPSNPEIAGLADQAGLSESRFMSLFKQQMGLPVRQYLLWLRLRRAAELWEQGITLTELGAEVGFYDQAHFTRTVRRMFDLSPSWLTNPDNLKLHHCGF